MRLLLILALALLLPITAAYGETVKSDQAMLAFKKLKQDKAAISSKRVLYLHFSPQDTTRPWKLSLPAGKGKLEIRTVTGRWRQGRFSLYRSLGLKQTINLGSDQEVALTASHDLTVKLKAHSSRISLSRLPYLTREKNETITTPTDPPTDEDPNSTVSPPSVQIAAVGDIACNPGDGNFNGGLGTETACSQARVAAMVSPSDEKVLLLGDIQYPAGLLSDYQNGFGPSWSPLAARLKPAPGNHDYGSGNINDYLSYFASLGVETGGANGYYAFTLGNWRIISLNSNCSIVACASGSAQQLWLSDQLSGAREAGQCALGYWHHPRASGGLHGDSAAVEGLWRTFYQQGGDLVLAGHDHHYQRFSPLDGDGNPSADGVASFVVGTGGVNLRSAVDRPGSAKIISDSFGLLRLNLDQAGYRYQWVGDSGSDSGEGACR